MKRLTLILLFALIPSVSPALDLSLSGAVERGLESNRGYKAYQMLARASEEDIGIARSRLLPSVILRSNYALQDKTDSFLVNSDAFAPGIPPQNVELPFDNRVTYGMALTIEQPIFSGGQLINRYGKSKILYDQTRHLEERQRRLLIFDIKRAYLNALKEQLQRETLGKIIISKKERLRVARELSGEGYLTEEDVLIADTDLAARELDLFRIDQKAEHALSTLRRLLNLPESEPLVLTERLRNLSLAATLQEIRESAVALREDLKAAQSYVSASDREVKIAQGEFYPKAWLQGKYLVQKETATTRPQVWMLTAQLEWSLFEWGRSQSDVAKAKAAQQRFQYEYEELTKAVSLEADGAWRACKEREREVDYLEKKLKTSEYRYERIIERFAERKVKLADLLEGEADFFKSYNDYLGAIIDLNIQIAYAESIASVSEGKWTVTREKHLPDFSRLGEKADKAISAGEEETSVFKSKKGSR